MSGSGSVWYNMKCDNCDTNNGHLTRVLHNKVLLWSRVLCDICWAKFSKQFMNMETPKALMLWTKSN